MSSLTIRELETQIQSSELAGLHFRTHSNVLKQWPWENGLPLQHGAMATCLAEMIRDTDQEDQFVDLVLVSCSNVLSLL
jgi:hypothetical protein